VYKGNNSTNKNYIKRRRGIKLTTFKMRTNVKKDIERPNRRDKRLKGGHEAKKGH